MSATYTTTRDGERLDLICYRWYGTLSGRVVERAIDATPSLARHDPASLPAGVVITLPDAPSRGAPPPRIF